MTDGHIYRERYNRMTDGHIYRERYNRMTDGHIYRERYNTMTDGHIYSERYNRMTDGHIYREYKVKGGHFELTVLHKKQKWNSEIILPFFVHLYMCEHVCICFYMYSIPNSEISDQFFFYEIWY